VLVLHGHGESVLTSQGSVDIVTAAPDRSTFARLRAISDAPAARTRPAAFVAAAIVLATYFAFSPALDNRFVEWDDNVLFTNNPHYRGLGWSQLRWMLTSAPMGHYVPVTWLSHGLDYVLWGMDPAGYHFVNVVLHAASAALFFFVALRLLRAATSGSALTVHVGAAVAALFFALHPLRAESVAWVTERRDVLSGLFFLLTLLLYLQARDLTGGASARRHAAAACCYLFAILSKSMVMTLPAVLILLDVYPFRRIDSRPGTWTDPALWREKIPYLALGALAAMLGYWAQAANQFITTLTSVPWSARPALITYSLWFYVSKTIAPVQLAALYEMPARVDPLAPRFVLPAIAVTGITVGLVLLRRRFPAALAAWIAYVIVLSPVMGVVHSGFQLAHDRYSYLTCLGFALLVGGAAGSAVGGGRRSLIRPALARAVGVAFAAWLLALGVLTWHQVQVWRDSNTLWRHAVDADPDCSVCLHNLGADLYNAGLPQLAQAHFDRFVSARPDRERGLGDVALVAAALGNLPRAETTYRMFLARYPEDLEAHNNLGMVLMAQGKPREALREFLVATGVEPGNARYQINAAMALLDLGSRPEALARASWAVERHPEIPYGHFVLGLTHVALGERDAADRELRILRFMNPKLAGIFAGALVESW
jgi:tetratricopeptide (TPR) repeat protein